MSALRDQPLFEGVPDERLAQWEAKCTARDYADGEVVYNDEVPLEGFLLLVEGRVSTAATIRPTGATWRCGSPRRAVRWSTA